MQDFILTHFQSFTLCSISYRPLSVNNYYIAVCRTGIPGFSGNPKIFVLLFIALFVVYLVYISLFFIVFCYYINNLYSLFRMEFLPTENVKLFVLTGGPCGGKSSLLNELNSKMASQGVDVYTVPEVPSLLISNGCPYPGINAPKEQLLTYEKTMLTLQLQAENSFHAIAASTGRKSIVVCDRAANDISAYVPSDFWCEIIESCGQTRDGLLNRYDCVIHLLTAADGAEEFYTTSNNAARKETPEEARALDVKTQGAWIDHPRRHIVDNSYNDFNAKINAAVAILEKHLM